MGTSGASGPGKAQRINRMPSHSTWPVDAGYRLDDPDDVCALVQSTDGAPGSARAIPTAPPKDWVSHSTSNAHANELARRVAASLAAAHADLLTAALAACAGDPARYEASVRVGPDGVPAAGRMMIEGASPTVLDAIAHALDIVL